jgi:hypothetical protein
MTKSLVSNQSMGGLVNKHDNCRYFRVEVRVPNEGRRFYSLKNRSKSQARIEAQEIVTALVETFQDEKIAWRMTGDKKWTFGPYSFEARIAKKSWFDKFAYYFFALD